MVASREAVVRAWLPALLYMAGIFVLSSLQIHPPGIEQFPLHDKGMHICEYSGLGFLLAHATMRTWPDRALWRLALLAIVIGAAWAVLDELHQALVPGRQADVLDAAADTVGTTFGVVVRWAGRVVAGMRARRARLH